MTLSTRWLGLLFFVSGFAALVYQVVWQRALYATFGINVESVTVVVTAFLAGLGAGSLFGGVVSRSRGSELLLFFGLAEAGVGAYGLVSLRIFAWVGRATLSAGDFERAVAVFAVLLLPTLLMGATLPMLVAFAVRLRPNVGAAVSQLYYVNTVGSGIAAFASVFVILGALGEAYSVAFAAALNGAVAALAQLMYFRRPAAS